MARKRNDEHIVTLVASLDDGTYIVEHPDGRLERKRTETDWAALENLTDAEIETAAMKDPDAMPSDFDWSEAVVVAPPRKTPISIRVDEDVLNYFRNHGAGYQRRINAVLRSYVDQKQKSPTRKKRA